MVETNDLIEKVRRFTKMHPELLDAHHFLFDLRLSTGPIDYIVMGINPGETAADKKGVPGPTEETSAFDFHDECGRGRSSKRWLKNIDYFLQTERVLLAEYFFGVPPMPGRLSPIDSAR